MNKLFVAISCILLCALSVHAQKEQLIDSLVSEKLDEMTLVFSNENNAVENSDVYVDFAEFDSVFISETIVQAELIEKIIEEHEAKIRLIKRDFGFSLRSNYTENLNPGFGEMDDYLIYNRRFQAGIDWDLLNNGIVERKDKKLIAENNKVSDVLKNQMDFRKKHYQANRYIVLYLFNRAKVDLLAKRSRIVNKKAELARELFYLKYYTREQLLEILADQSEIVSMYNVYDSYNKQLKYAMQPGNLPNGILPLFDIDLQTAIGLSMANDNDSILKLQLQNLKLQDKIINNLSLTAFGRYNYYMAPNNNNRDFVSVGLNFKMPLPLNVNSTNQYTNARIERLKLEDSLSDTNIEIELLNLFYEFRYKQKQYYTFIEKERKYNERLRRYRAMLKLENYGFHPFKAIDVIDDLYQIKIEMLDLHQMMYMSALQMYYKLPSGKFIDFLKPVNLEELFKIRDRSKAALYIWSKTFDSFSVNYIDEYIRYNDISTAIISVRKDRRYAAETNALIKMLHKAGAKCELLIGNNNLLFNQNIASSLHKLTQGISLKLIDAIHLDVEPHTFDNWHENKEALMAKYVHMLLEAKEFCDFCGCKLSISIPLFFNEPSLKSIYSVADKVYLMAYEQKTMDRLINKVEEEMALGKDKTIVAYRTKDFENRLFMEEFISECQKKLGLSNHAIHDFNTLVELDKKSFDEDK